MDLLTEDDIASLRVPGSIVVMSGCSSGSGQIVPGTGLLGLARAWLVAGASAVIVTEWPTKDNTTEFFEHFYTYLRDSERDGGIPTAEALRRAQIEALKSGTWRTSPVYWAAYQTIGIAE